MSGRDPTRTDAGSQTPANDEGGEARPTDASDRAEAFGRADGTQQQDAFELSLDDQVPDDALADESRGQETVTGRVKEPRDAFEQTRDFSEDLDDDLQPVGERVTGAEDQLAGTVLGDIGERTAAIGGDSLRAIDDTIGGPVRGFGSTVGGASETASRAVQQEGSTRLGEGVSDVVDVVAGDQVSRGAGEFVTGVSQTGTQFSIGAPGLLASTAASTEEVGETVSEDVSERGVTGGLAESGRTGGAVALDTAEQSVAAAQKNPARTLGGAAASFGIGSAAGRALETAVLRARRAAQVDRGSDVDSSLDELTDESVSDPDDSLPTFDTSTDAPTREAVGEFGEGSRDVPESIKEAAGSDQVVFRSDQERLPGDLDVDRGTFELEGLFTADQLSPINLGSRSGGSGVPGLRLPALRRQPQRGAVFEIDDVRGMPGRAAESGVAVEGPDGDIIDRFPPTMQGLGRAQARADDIEGAQRVPDPDTAGSQFLRDEATEGTAQIRATGDRTSEREGVIPPGTRFERVETGRLDVDGEPGTLDVFRLNRSDDGDAETTSPTTGGPDGDGGSFFTAREISERRRGEGLPDEPPTSPLPPSTTGTSAAGSSGSGSAFGSSSVGSSFGESLFGSSGGGSGGSDGSGGSSNGGSDGGSPTGGTSTPPPPPTGGTSTPPPPPTGGTSTPPPPPTGDTSTPPPPPTGGTSTPPPPPPGGDTTTTRTPRLELDPDDEREREGLFEEEGLSEEFTNPVATTESVLSSDANPGGSDELSASDSGLTDSFKDTFGGDR